MGRKKSIKETKEFSNCFFHVLKQTVKEHFLTGGGNIVKIYIYKHDKKTPADLYISGIEMTEGWRTFDSRVVRLDEGFIRIEGAFNQIEKGLKKLNLKFEINRRIKPLSCSYLKFEVIIDFRNYLQK